LVANVPPHVRERLAKQRPQSCFYSVFHSATLRSRWLTVKWLARP
jgi:hypothetical protein